MTTRILIVDDEPDIRRLVSFSLTRHGFDVIEAGDGLSACSVAEAERPDLILMDVMMPIMNGFEAVKRLKSVEATAAIPVVMLSAKSQVYEQEEGLESGATAYITKPFTPAELVEQVTHHLEGKG
jgi:DNA-binding response OmpR family regulator